MEEQTLQKIDWFNGMIDDCRGIVVEAEFTSRWTIIQGYHDLGKRISQEKENFTRSEIYGKQVVKLIAEKIKKSESSIDKAIRFFEQYPDLDLLPEGKNISWWKICQKYLSQPKEEVSEELPETSKTPTNSEEQVSVLANDLDTITFTLRDTLDLYIEVRGMFSMLDGGGISSMFAKQLKAKFSVKEIEESLKVYTGGKSDQESGFLTELSNEVTNER